MLLFRCDVPVSLTDIYDNIKTHIIMAALIEDVIHMYHSQHIIQRNRKYGKSGSRHVISSIEVLYIAYNATKSTAWKSRLSTV